VQSACGRDGRRGRAGVRRRARTRAWPGPDKCSPRVRLARPLVRKKRFLLPLRSTPTTQISSISLANAKSSTDKVIPSTDSAYRGYSTPPLPDEMRLDFALDCDWTSHGDRLVWLRDGGLIRHGRLASLGNESFGSVYCNLHSLYYTPSF
jgi:hypothetical protein